MLMTEFYISEICGTEAREVENLDTEVFLFVFTARESVFFGLMTLKTHQAETGKDGAAVWLWNYMKEMPDTSHDLKAY
jgi:hypothetical protein